MNLYLNLLLLVASIHICLCSIIHNRNAIHEDHPGKCYSEVGQHAFSPGETYTPIGRCAKLTCIEPGHYSAQTCGATIKRGCERLPADETQPYPDCCRKFLCKYPNGTEYITAPKEKTRTVINTFAED